MKKIYFALTAFLMTVVAFSQGTITGTVFEENSLPLPGASIVVQGTTNGTSTDFDGNFTIEISENEGVLVVSYIGYVTKKIPFTGPGKIEKIVLDPSAQELEGVIVTGVQDIAKDRKTPVAVSTIKFAEIQEKLGSQELPEILNTTPSIYATKSGGGFGDSRINIRGFDTNNSAIMINGVPVNDMENGRVFWSNWAGLSDVTSAIQVQRGLGSSKLAVSSVGGTINVVTKTSQNPKGGSIGATVGNDGYVKTLASYSSGVLENGFSTSLLLSRTGGNMYADGTNFEGYNFFVGLGYTTGVHNFEFMVTGAPQWHNQRSRAVSIENQIQYGKGDGEPNRRYNEDWGYLNGEEYSFRRNFYHKPVVSLSWNWEISSKTTLQTNAYASFGRGGGTGEIGEINGQRQFALPRTADGLIRVDDIVAYNSGQLVPDFSDTPREQIDGLYVNNSDNNPNENNTNGITRRASVNSHNWFGLLANFNNRISDKLTIDFGIDVRKYTGFHYRRVDNRLGGDAYQQTDDRNNPPGEGATNLFFETYKSNPPWWVFGSIDDEEKIDYNNTGFVNWLGVFGQMEYNFTEDITGFVQGALSNQGFAREEFFNETPPEKTDFENILGGNIKAGLNWNINENHNLFANGGYYEKQPLFDAVFINFGNNLNPNLTNEKITGFELGYGYRSSTFRANVNLYRTSWKDRFDNVTATFNFGEPDEVRGTANLLGITQIHSGLEIDGRFQASDKLAFTGMISIGNWEYKDNISATFFDNDQSPILDENGDPLTETLELDGVKVGDAAQFTAFIGADYNILDNLGVDFGYRFADNLYADFDATDIDENGALKLPSFGLADAGISYGLPIGDSRLSFRLNVNNVFDTTYIAESDTNNFVEAGDENYDGINVSNRVFFGFGRTWNASVRFNF